MPVSAPRKREVKQQHWERLHPLKCPSGPSGVLRQVSPLPVGVLNPWLWRKIWWVVNHEAVEQNSEHLESISFCCQSEVGRLTLYKGCGLNLTPFISISSWLAEGALYLAFELLWMPFSSHVCFQSWVQVGQAWICLCLQLIRHGQPQPEAVAVFVCHAYVQFIPHCIFTRAIIFNSRTEYFLILVFFNWSRDHALLSVYTVLRVELLRVSVASSTEILARKISVNMLTAYSSYSHFEPCFLGTQKFHKHTV